MATITYCKGLPTPADELNPLGKTQLEMFLAEYSVIFHVCASETANHLLSGEPFNKNEWRKSLQAKYNISARHAKGMVTWAEGAVDAAKANRQRHIKVLTAKAKSCADWIKKTERKLKNARKFYRKKNWHDSKSGCVFALACSIQYRDTNWQNLRFQLHNKKRKLHHYQKQVKYLKAAPIRATIPRGQAYVVGAKNGIEVIKVNPAYSSLIGGVKYTRMYGLASDEAAALVIARRGMKLGEKLPGSITAYISVNDSKHVGSHWNQLNSKLKRFIRSRHTYYGISNWEFLVNPHGGSGNALKISA